MVPIRPNINDGDNSDVSDEENISRAARSIESPPESPQGTHFESPPASPDPENKPGTPSPIQSPEDSASYGSPVRSPDSQADSRLKNESPPRSPDSYLPRSPNCFGNRTPPSEPRSQSPTSNYPRSPSPVESLLLNQSPKNKSLDSIQSPDSHSPQSPQESQRLTSPSPRSPSPPYKPTHRNESPQEQNSQSPPRDPRWFKSRSPSNSPQSTNQQRTRRDSFNSDDGRSNISSASSFGSPQRSPANPPEPTRESKSHVEDIKSHADDLSDVSDLECMSDDELEKPECKENGNVRGAIIDQKKDFTTGLEADTEQLDFEAEEKEEGECDAPQPAAKPQPVAKTKGEKKEEGAISEGEDEGELKGDDLEEGEITDEGENRPEETEPRPVCRFYHRGQCTWGANCRFIHPGVTDKGNYTMFEMVRPLVPVNGPPMPMPMYGPPMDPYRPMMDRPPMMPMGPQMGPPMGPQMGPPMYQPPPPRKEEVAPPVVVESAWERGLRQAKEMLRKSSKRKETEVDFEEKKMNLSIGQDDLDKENDYYTRAGSPVLDNLERYSGKGEEKRYRTMSDRFDDYGGGPEGFYYQRNTEQVWHQRPHYDESMRGVYSRSSSKYYSNSQTRTSRERERDKEYYSSSKSSKKYSQREVIVQRPEKTASWKDDSPPAKPARYAEGRSGGRGDEWADPWMRSKTSPLSRKRSRKASYSSGSSYSSSSSRSSSHSSSSSYSRSRSRSRSSRSRSRSKKPSKLSPPRRLMRAGSPLGRGLKVAMMPTMPSTEKKATAMLMNPPPPSPRSKGKTMVATNPSPPIERVRATVPTSTKLQKAASAVAAAMRSARSRSKSSRSSGSSDSSGSSSDSSDTSLSSSSSIRQKRIVIDERLALAQAMNMKVKAMDALKLSGQKQQIKLTLKGSGAGERTTSMPIVVGKKRPAESPPMDFSPPKAGGKVMLKKTAPSRREELLKQLKAVEDAIARKRSKIS